MLYSISFFEVPKSQANGASKSFMSFYFCHHRRMAAFVGSLRVWGDWLNSQCVQCTLCLSLKLA